MPFHVYHYFYHGWKANPEAAAIGFIVAGHTGVGLFFTLSGFLFMLIGMAAGKYFHDHRQGLKRGGWPLMIVAAGPMYAAPAAT